MLTTNDWAVSIVPCMSPTNVRAHLNAVSITMAFILYRINLAEISSEADVAR
jgi:hypothetical protein